MKNNFKCEQCKHYDGRWTGTCKAFPKGIPIAIGSGQISHKKKFPGQKNDTVFGLKDEITK